jgi:hypothetical protein
MILNPGTLNFWSGFVPGKGLELTDIVTLVEPRFNQLTVGGCCCCCARWPVLGRLGERLQKCLESAAAGRQPGRRARLPGSGTGQGGAPSAIIPGCDWPAPALP